jgi:hypothetical protein
MLMVNVENLSEHFALTGGAGENLADLMEGVQLVGVSPRAGELFLHRVTFL